MQMGSWQELADPRDLTKIFTTPEYAAWRSLRESDDSRYIGLAMPRFLARLPYGAKINPASSDLHETLARFAVEINTQSAPVRQASAFALQMAPNVKVDPLGWLGQSVAIYADPDPFWDEMAKAPKPSEFLEANVWRMPVALRAEVSNGFKLAARILNSCVCRQ